MENIVMISLNLPSGILCLLLGIVIRTGKANFLIAGFNTMSEHEKAKWNMKAVSNFTGWLLIISSLILLVACIPLLLGIFTTIALYGSFGVFIVVVLTGAIYVNVSSRFKNK